MTAIHLVYTYRDCKPHCFVITRVRKNATKENILNPTFLKYIEEEGEKKNLSSKSTAFNQWSASLTNTNQPQQHLLAHRFSARSSLARSNSTHGVSVQSILPSLRFDAQHFGSQCLASLHFDTQHFGSQRLSSLRSDAQNFGSQRLSSLRFDAQNFGSQHLASLHFDAQRFHCTSNGCVRRCTSTAMWLWLCSMLHVDGCVVKTDGWAPLASLLIIVGKDDSVEGRHHKLEKHFQHH